jgi:hypothetical protein
MWADILKFSTPATHEQDIKAQLEKLIKSAIADAYTKGKVGSKLAVFRIAATTWDAFLNRLATSDIKSPLKYDDYFNTMSVMQPELYTLCVDNRTFIGHKPTSAQEAIINNARRTLKTDPQVRLARTIAASLATPARQEVKKRW